MKRVLAVTAILVSGLSAGPWLRVDSPTALAGVEKCAAKNGDVNADGNMDVADAVTILGHLFLGRPTELVPLCAPPAAASGLPDTGQERCYDFVNQNWVKVPCAEAACRGQDAQSATGCPTEGRFTIALVVATVAAKDRLREEWYIGQLSSLDEGTRFHAAFQIGASAVPSPSKERESFPAPGKVIHIIEAAITIKSGRGKSRDHLPGRGPLLGTSPSGRIRCIEQESVTHAGN